MDTNISELQKIQAGAKESEQKPLDLTFDLHIMRQAAMTIRSHVETNKPTNYRICAVQH